MVFTIDCSFIAEKICHCVDAVRRWHKIVSIPVVLSCRYKGESEMRRAKDDGDGFQRIVESGRIGSCPKCGSTRSGASVSKCPYCSKYFCTDCSPNGNCLNEGDGGRHDTYEWVPIVP